MAHLRVATSGGYPTKCPPCPRDQEFLDELARLLPQLDDARAAIASGIAEGEWLPGVQGARKLLAVGLLAGDAARKIGADL